MIRSADFDFSDPGFIQNPYPAYDLLREQSPVFYSEKHCCWIITKYALAKELLLKIETKREPAIRTCPWSKASRSFSGVAGYIALRKKAGELIGYTIGAMYGKEHIRLKKAFMEPFLPFNLKKIEKGMQQTLDEIFTTIDTEQPVDLIKQVGEPFALRTIVQLTGLDKANENWLKEQANNLGYYFKFVPNAKDKERALNAFINLVDFYSRHIPTIPEKGFIDRITAAYQSGQLNEDEVLSNLATSTLSGQETSVPIAAHLFYSFMKWPGQFKLLRENRHLVESAVEESFRFHTIGNYIPRHAHTDIIVGDMKISRGDKVLILIGCANRDESVFNDPALFDITRNPNPHLNFGAGSHICSGRALARLHGKVLLNYILDHFPGIQFIEEQEISWQKDFSVHALEKFYVKLK